MAYDIFSAVHGKSGGRYSSWEKLRAKTCFDAKLILSTDVTVVKRYLILESYFQKQNEFLLQNSIFFRRSRTQKKTTFKNFHKIHSLKFPLEVTYRAHFSYVNASSSILPQSSWLNMVSIAAEKANRQEI